jgi:disulfide oxidoreductase YuzD
MCEYESLVEGAKKKSATTLLDPSKRATTDWLDSQVLVKWKNEGQYVMNTSNEYKTDHVDFLSKDLATTLFC